MFLFRNRLSRKGPRAWHAGKLLSQRSNDIPPPIDNRQHVVWRSSAWLFLVVAAASALHADVLMWGLSYRVVSAYDTSGTEHTAVRACWPQK